MAINFHPKAGAVLLCSYEPGFRAPEMTKQRPVIVVTPRLRRREGLCTVVPLSTTDPEHIEDYHYGITFARALPKPWSTNPCWVKADMFAAVGFHRLHLIGIGRDQNGKRKYLNFCIPDNDLIHIQSCILNALNLGHLTKHL